MKNLRFKLAIGKNLVFILTSLPKARRMIKQADKYSDSDRFDFALEIMSRMCKASKSKIAIYGEENLPKESGFMMCPNHQGKFDGIAVLDSYKKPCRVLWRADTADKFVARECCGLISARTIDVEHNLLGALRTINAVGDDLKEKITYVIFPEGGYTDNKNNLQEFKSGCFRAALRSKAPIVPVCRHQRVYAPLPIGHKGNALRRRIGIAPIGEDAR